MQGGAGRTSLVGVDGRGKEEIVLELQNFIGEDVNRVEKEEKRKGKCVISCVSGINKRSFHIFSKDRSFAILNFKIDFVCNYSKHIIELKLNKLKIYFLTSYLYKKTRNRICIAVL